MKDINLLNVQKNEVSKLFKIVNLCKKKGNFYALILNASIVMHKNLFWEKHLHSFDILNKT